jgi:hypothetical protein
MTTGNSCWCVKGGQLQGGEIFLQADRGGIAPHGELMPFAPGIWSVCFSALPDGRATAVHGGASGGNHERPFGGC